MPAGALYLWMIFQRLSLRRSNNGFGVNAISWPEIEAFNRMSKMDLAPWEVEIIEHLDALFLDSQGEQKPEDPEE